MLIDPHGQVAAINARLAMFSEAEVATIHLISERLAMGREHYGPLNPHDGRDWAQEGLEEAADLCVYLTAEIQRRDRGMLDCPKCNVRLVHTKGLEYCPECAYESPASQLVEAGQPVRCHTALADDQRTAVRAAARRNAYIRAKSQGPRSHGNNWSYVTGGCRCEPCCDARSEYLDRQYAKRREARVTS